MNKTRLCMLVIGLVLGMRSDGVQAQSADQATLRQGVTEIAAPGLPGPIAVFGPQAFPVIVGSVDGGLAAPVVAASYLGQGKVAAFGHPGYLEKEALDTADTGPPRPERGTLAGPTEADPTSRRPSEARTRRLPSGTGDRGRNAGRQPLDRTFEK